MPVEALKHHMGKGEDPDEHETPHELVPRASAERTFLANLALRVGALGSSAAEIARSWDTATPDQRRAFAVDLASKLGEAGDGLHEARQLVLSFAP